MAVRISESASRALKQRGIDAGALNEAQKASLDKNHDGTVIEAEVQAPGATDRLPRAVDPRSARQRHRSDADAARVKHTVNAAAPQRAPKGGVEYYPRPHQDVVKRARLPDGSVVQRNHPPSTGKGPQLSSQYPYTLTRPDGATQPVNLEVAKGSGTITTSRYGPDDTTIKTTHLGEGKSSHQVLDRMGRPTSIRDATGKETRFEYLNDTAKAPFRVHLPGPPETSWTRDMRFPEGARIYNKYPLPASKDHLPVPVWIATGPMGEVAVGTCNTNSFPLPMGGADYEVHNPDGTTTEYRRGGAPLLPTWLADMLEAAGDR